ncbi:MAG: RnfABCDGE type electron transport complex subunit D [Huintestinicola sp.]
MKKKKNEMLTTFVRTPFYGDDKEDKAPDDFHIMASMLLVLAVFDGMAVYCYGQRALAVILVCVLVCWGTDALCLIMRRKSLHIHDLSPIITGLALAAMLPASMPFTAAAAASVFAIAIAKHPLGGHGYEIFSPAAAGYIFAELSFPQHVLAYPKPFEKLPMDNVIWTGLSKSFSAGAGVSGNQGYSDFELLIGSFAGPMGCTFTVLTIVCIFVLFFRKAVSPAVFFGEVGVFLAWNIAFGTEQSIRTAIFGGMTLFAAAMFTAHGNHIPKGIASRIFFGLFAGLLMIAVSAMSALENPAVYVSIIAAPCGRLFDRIKLRSIRRRRARKIFGEDINETIDLIGGEENGTEN